MGAAAAESSIGFRGRLLQVLEHRRVHNVLLGLLILDVVAVVSGGYLELQYMQSKFEDSRAILIACIEAGSGRRLESSADACEEPEEYGNETLEDVEEALVLLSIFILSLFLLEHVLHVFASPWKHCSDWKNILDTFVVALSLVLEIGDLTKSSISASAGAIVLARLWRYARIVHGVADVSGDLADEKAKRGTIPTEASPWTIDLRGCRGTDIPKDFVFKL